MCASRIWAPISQYGPLNFGDVRNVLFEGSLARLCVYWGNILKFIFKWWVKHDQISSESGFCTIQDVKLTLWVKQGAGSFLQKRTWLSLGALNRQCCCEREERINSLVFLALHLHPDNSMCHYMEGRCSYLHVSDPLCVLATSTRLLCKD